MDQEDWKSRQDHTAHLAPEAETQASKDLSEGFFPSTTSIWCIPDSQSGSDLSGPQSLSSQQKPYHLHYALKYL